MSSKQTADVAEELDALRDELKNEREKNLELSIRLKRCEAGIQKMCTGHDALWKMHSKTAKLIARGLPSLAQFLKDDSGNVKEWRALVKKVQAEVLKANTFLYPEGYSKFFKTRMTDNMRLLVRMFNERSVRSDRICKKLPIMKDLANTHEAAQKQLLELVRAGDRLEGRLGIEHAAPAKASTSSQK